MRSTSRRLALDHRTASQAPCFGRFLRLWSSKHWPVNRQVHLHKPLATPSCHVEISILERLKLYTDKALNSFMFFST